VKKYVEKYEPTQVKAQRSPDAKFASREADMKKKSEMIYYKMSTKALVG